MTPEQSEAIAALAVFAFLAGIALIMRIIDSIEKRSDERNPMALLVGPPTGWVQTGRDAARRAAADRHAERSRCELADRREGRHRS